MMEENRFEESLIQQDTTIEASVQTNKVQIFDSNSSNHSRVTVLLRRCLEYYQSVEGNQHFHNLPEFNYSDNLSSNDDSANMKDEIDSLSYFLDKHQSLCSARDYQIKLEKENIVFKSREQRFALDPLLKRRKLEQCDTGFLSILVIGLQNELSLCQNVLSSISMTMEQSSLQDLLHDYETNSGLNLDKLSYLENASLGPNIESSSAIDNSNCPQIQALNSENIALKMQLDRQSKLLQFLNSVGVKNAEFERIQNELYLLSKKSSTQSDDNSYISDLSVDAAIRHIHGLNETLRRREYSIQLMQSIEKKRDTRIKNLLVQNLQLGDLMMKIIESQLPVLHKRISCKEIINKADFEKILTTSEKCCCEKKGHSPLKESELAEVDERNSSEVTIKNLAFSTEVPTIHEEIDASICKNDYQTIFFRVSTLWAGKYAPPRWYNRIFAAFKKISSLSHDSISFKEDDTNFEKSDDTYFSRESLLAFCSYFDIVPQIVNLDMCNKYIEDEINHAFDELQPNSDEREIETMIEEEKVLLFPQCLRVLIRLAILRNPSNIQTSAILHRIVELFEHIVQHDFFSILPKKNDRDVVRPSRLTELNNTDEQSPKSIDSNSSSIKKPTTSPRKSKIRNRSNSSNATSNSNTLTFSRSPSLYSPSSPSRSQIISEINASDTSIVTEAISMKKNLWYLGTDLNPALNSGSFDSISPRRSVNNSPRLMKKKILETQMGDVFQPYYKLLNDCFKNYAKVDLNSSRTHSFEKIASSQKVISQAGFMRFLKDYQIFPDIIEKSCVMDIASAPPRSLEYDEFCYRLTLIAEKAEHRLEDIESGIEAKRAEFLKKMFTSITTPQGINTVSKESLLMSLEKTKKERTNVFDAKLVDILKNIINKQAVSSYSWKTVVQSYVKAANEYNMKIYSVKLKKASVIRKSTSNNLSPNSPTLDFSKKGVENLLKYITGHSLLRTNTTPA